jgi:hypothetical protein
MTRTADYLINGLKNRAIFPASQSLFDDAEILSTADDIIMSTIVPMIVGLREEFFVTKTLTSIVANQDEYSIPYRAIGRILREIKLVGDVISSKRRLTRVSLGDEHYFRSSSTPQGFYMKGDKVVLVPTPAQDGNKLELWWLMQPGLLVPTTSAANIVSITLNANPLLTDIVCSSIPTSWTAPVKMDFIQGNQGCQTLGYDITPITVSGVTLTFTTTYVPTDLAAGDWVALQRQSPVIQLPDEVYHLLESNVAQHMLTSLGDFDGADRYNKEIDDEEKRIKLLLEPRVEGEPKKIINRSGLLRGSRSRYRFGWVSR